MLAHRPTLNLAGCLSDASTPTEWSWKYNVHDLVERTNPLGQSVRWTHKANGLPESVEAAGRRALFFYDRHENLDSYQLPNAASLTFKSNRRGEVLESTDARGATTRIPPA